MVWAFRRRQDGCRARHQRGRSQAARGYRQAQFRCPGRSRKGRYDLQSGRAGQLPRQAEGKRLLYEVEQGIRRRRLGRARKRRRLTRLIETAAETSPSPPSKAISNNQIEVKDIT